MPIGDLLASIGGGSETAPKRKAEDQFNIPSKAPRTSSSLSRPIQPSRPLDRPSASNGNGIKSSTPAVLKPTNGAHRISKPTTSTRSLNNAPARAPVPSGGPPKKGSYAEIMARAKAAQQTMGQVGKIQHKKVEKGAVKKEKEVPSRPEPRTKTGTRPAGKTAASTYSGTSKPTARPSLAANANGGSRDGRGRPQGKPPAGRDKTGAVEDAEKKPKKAASATTGYTGTARPKPGATVKKDKAPRGGALLNRQAPRPNSSKYSRYEEDYDEELDDFIDYDDEEDAGEPRYGYADESDSDMEAGMDELDIEERRAEQIARREDIEEERRERQHKAAKEDRRRLAMDPKRR